MKVALVSTEADPVVALYARNRWLDLSGAYPTYQWLTYGVKPQPVHHIEPFLEADLLTPENLEKVVACLEQHDLLATYQLPGEPNLLLPFRPKQIFAMGRNYAAHAAETGHDAPKEPILFSKSPRSCIGHGQPIIVRPDYGQVDHEAELAVVIGRKGKDIEPSAVKDHIAAYTLLNDVTARQMQKKDIEKGHPWFRSKSLDTFCPLGPYLVLPDEIPWPVELDIECRVNGEVRQHSNTAHFLFSLPKMISYISRLFTLEPGDIISTGTPEGIGPIRPGDTVEVVVPQIGVLSNPVVEG